MRSMTKINKVLFIFLFVFLLLPYPSQADTSNPLTGTYYGTATIEQPAALGIIDLAFYLDVTGSVIMHNSSYIVLEKTLLFPAVAQQIGGKDVGPRLNGVLSTTEFILVSDDFSSTLPGGGAVTRNIQLINATVTNSGNTIKGTYQETITGLKNPVVITGTFMLVKPVVASISGLKDLDSDGCYNLTDIRMGGSDPSIIEFPEISAALYLYYNPGITPNLCTTQADIECTQKECIIQKALQEYYQSLK